MWLIVGLGNPGAKYAHNRHNVGFMAIDMLADKLSAGAWSGKFKSELAEAQWQGGKILLLKPQTYMNLSGEAVGAAAGFYKIPPERICVLHDELDLPPGDVRLKQGGSHGGHNGLKSIDEFISRRSAHSATASGKDGSNYLRLRIGIGHPRALTGSGRAPASAGVNSARATGDNTGSEALAHYSVTDYVLGNFMPAEREVLAPLLTYVARHLMEEIARFNAQGAKQMRLGNPT